MVTVVARPTWAWTCLAVVVAAACANPAAGPSTTPAPSPSPAVATTPSPTRTPGPTGFAVPARIDAAYVDRVLAALDRVFGEAVRTAMREGVSSERFQSIMHALFGDEVVGLYVGLVTAEQHKGWKDFRRNPGDPVTRVHELITATPTCVFAAIDHDLTPLLRQRPRRKLPQRYAILVPLPERRDRLEVNPTPWMYSYFGFPQGGGRPQDQCR